jgi:hypothetical protein
LEEIGDQFERNSLFTDAEKAFETLIKLEPSNGTAHYKLGVVMTNEKNPNYDKTRAVDCYKQAIENVNGENYK